MLMFPEAKLYIDGVLRPAAGGKTHDDISPWTGDIIARAADASPENVNAAIAAARRAFDHTDWPAKHDERYKLLVKFRDFMVANREKLVEIARHEAGAAVGAASRAHVNGALNGMNDLLKCFSSVKWEEDRGRRNEYGRQ